MLKQHSWAAKWLRTWKCFAIQLRGQDVIEYSLLLAFLALGSVALLMGTSQSVGSVWNTANSHLEKGKRYAKGQGN